MKSGFENLKTASFPMKSGGGRESNRLGARRPEPEPVRIGPPRTSRARQRTSATFSCRAPSGVERRRKYMPECTSLRSSSKP